MTEFLRKCRAASMIKKVGIAMAADTRSGTLVGPGICRKCLPVGKVICASSRYCLVWRGSNITIRAACPLPGRVPFNAQECGLDLSRNDSSGARPDDRTSAGTIYFGCQGSSDHLQMGGEFEGSAAPAISSRLRYRRPGAATSGGKTHSRPPDNAPLQGPFIALAEVADIRKHLARDLLQAETSDRL